MTNRIRLTRPTESLNIKNLLDLVFEGHEVRVAIIDDYPLFVSADVCAALGLTRPRDAIERLEAYQKRLIRLPETGGVPSGSSRRNPGGNPNVSAVTLSGLFALILLSRKPAARRFQRWIGEEVLPQILKYGTYVEGATPAERCSLLYKRYKIERRGEIAIGEAALVESRLLTVVEFRQVHAIPAHDALAFAATLCQSARDLHERPRKFFTRRGQVNAWSLSALFAALGRYQPRLPLPLT